MDYCYPCCPSPSVLWTYPYFPISSMTCALSEEETKVGFPFWSPHVNSTTTPQYVLAGQVIVATGPHIPLLCTEDTEKARELYYTGERNQHLTCFWRIALVWLSSQARGCLTIAALHCTALRYTVQDCVDITPLHTIFRYCTSTSIHPL